MIRPATTADAAALCTIYNHYVLETTIAFEEAAVTPAEMGNRVRETVDSSLPWLVWEELASIQGFAYASKWKGRCAYRHSAEATVYLEPKSTSRGVGSRLYQALLTDLRQRSFHAVIGGIALPNEASIALHERLGFRKVAHFEQVGWKFGRWIDVAYWQLLL
ncbi:MAG TPA: arsinothricin resistance N-acetyltransferase ArsN1 family B [Acidobacteriaceae bacterium]|jgi:L-amino acid N-acyltransferase YncA|nr:arsinothricin resistance N-acetyltransferase ArsN1 family B [Acidobacteriaceae bacterium]